MTWQPGDLALAKAHRPGHRWTAIFTGEPLDGPRPGSVHVVEGVGTVTGITALYFSEWPEVNGDRLCFMASRFHKIPPLTDEERADFYVENEHDLKVLILETKYRDG